MKMGNRNRGFGVVLIAGLLATVAGQTFAATVTGTVFNDPFFNNAPATNDVAGTGNNAGGLFVNILNTSNVVQATGAVGAAGTYSVTGLAAGTFRVQINSVAGTVGVAAPIQTLPAGWSNTGDEIVAVQSATINGVSDDFTVTAAGTQANVNFGIQFVPILACTTMGSESINTPNYQLNYHFNPANNTTPVNVNNLAGGTIDFVARLITPPGAVWGANTGAGTPASAGGIQIKTNAVIGDYVYVQPTQVTNATTDAAEYEFNFSSPVTGFSLVDAGLNNRDTHVFTAFNGAASVPITATNFSNFNTTAAGIAWTITGNIVDGTSTLGGTNVDDNFFTLTIPQTITRLVVRAHKSTGTSTVTTGFHTMRGCFYADTDHDGLADSIDIDDDNDGIPDITEGGGTDGSADADGDGIPNFRDPSFAGFVDGNGDGINDNFDLDKDGKPNHLDVDADNDGITDVREAGGVDANGDGVLDVMQDSDGDGVIDVQDADADGNGTIDGGKVDTDADGIVDAADADADGNNVLDGGKVDADGDGLDDLLDPDDDGDGLADTVDGTAGGTPLVPANSDGNGRPNYLDIDADDDGIPDNIEAQSTAGYVLPSGSDVDNDGLDDAYDPDNNSTGAIQDAFAGAVVPPLVNSDQTDLADWLDPDSDNDGFTDRQENGDTSPFAVTDSDGDGLVDAYDDVPTPPAGEVDVNDNINDPNPSTQPDSDGDVNASGSNAVPLIRDLDWRDVFVPAQFQGTVWLDADRDGIQDIGEPGISDVAVEIWSAGLNGVIGGGDDVLVGTVYTDSQGNYVRGDLPPGNYYAQVASGNFSAPESLDDLTNAPGGSNTSTLKTLVAGQVADADFGYVPPLNRTAVEGTVWWDDDADGIQDPGEAGVANVPMHIWGCGLDDVCGNGDDTLYPVVFTNADGHYVFADKPAGKYYVSLNAVGPLAGATATQGPDSEGSTVSSDLILNSGDIYTGVDFGFTKPGLFSYTDRLWYDNDNDGVQDLGEAGIAGVTINLLDNTGEVVATVISDANGNFNFSGLQNGAYSVQVTDQFGKLLSFNGTTPDAITGNNAFNIAGADINFTGAPNFGYNRPASLGGTLYSDANNSSAQDSSETGLGGYTLELRDGICTPTVNCPTTTTAADGSYAFAGLIAGNYTVAVTAVPPGSITDDPVGALDNLAAVILVAGQSLSDLDFGYQNAALGDISGTVFDDVDADGSEEAGDNGIAGVTVELRNSLGQVVATAITDASGNYSFPDLPAGNYTVVVTDTAGILSGAFATTGLDQRAVNVTNGSNNVVDFGYAEDAATGSIVSSVWIDENGDGIRNGSEMPVSNVTVELFADENNDGIADGPAIATVRTDENGNYIFDQLPPGHYLINAVEAGNVTASLNPTTFAFASAPVDVVQGQTTTGASNFGYRPVGSAMLSGVIWSDVDGDGLREDQEVGIGDVEVRIINSSGTVVATVFTAADGSYSAPNLPPGDYFVAYRSIDPDLTGYDVDDPTNMPPNNIMYSVTLLAGNVVNGLDFGFEAPTPATTFGSVSGTIFFDGNANMAQNLGEQGLAGVTINLLDTFGNVVATTTTDVNGNYSFVGVEPGTYSVQITDQYDVLGGLNQTLLIPPFIAVNAGATTDVDAGFTREAGANVIGGQMFVDVDLDGTLDPTEIGIPGVTVDLWLDVNNDGVITPGIDNLIRSTITDAAGEYAFTDIPNSPAGTRYLIAVSDDAGVLTAGNYSWVNGPNDNVDGNSQDLAYYDVVLAAGLSNYTADYGFQRPVFTLSGTVFEDEDNGGDFDLGEPGAQSATVNVYQVVNGVRILVASVQTAADGTYSVPNLPNGTYDVVTVTTSSAVAGYEQTLPFTNGGVARITISSSNVTNVNFGFFNDVVLVTTPVSLAYFKATPSGNGLDVEWSTATESGNVGFLIYGRNPGGQWVKLTPQAIASQAVDSLEPLHYSQRLSHGGQYSEFAIEDVDLKGRSKLHGPFARGRAHGAKPQSTPIAWGTINTLTRDSLRNSRGRSLAARGPNGKLQTARLNVSVDGIQRVTYEQLLAAGVDLGGVPAAQIAITDAGVPVSRHVSANGLFGPGDSIEFVGHASRSLYAKANVYVLSIDARLSREPKAAVLNVRSAPNLVHEAKIKHAPDVSYAFSSPNGDPWFDAHVLAFGGPASLSRNFNVTGLAAGTASIKVDLWGRIRWDLAGNDHHVIVKLNGSTIADRRFDGITSHNIEMTLPAGLLVEGNNTFELHLPGDTGFSFDMVALEGFEVRHPRSTANMSQWTAEFSKEPGPFMLGGLLGGGQPIRGNPPQLVVWQGSEVRQTLPESGATLLISGEGTGRYYLASSTQAAQFPSVEAELPLAAAPISTDYLIVAHPALVDGVGPLVSLQQSRGFSTRVVTTESIFAGYSDYQADAEAVRDFIADVKPRYVLIVGGDSYDYHNNLGLGAISFVPTMYARTDDIVAFAPSDALLVDWDRDHKMDAAIGRIPARTLAELGAAVDKIVGYANRPSAFTAMLGTGKSDEGSTFTQSHDYFGVALGGAWKVNKASMDELGLDNARARFIEAINNGTQLVSFYGHSAPGILDFSRMFQSSDVASLTNTNNANVVTMFGCWNSYFVNPNGDTLANRLLLTPQVGAAAVYGATTLTSVQSHKLMGKELFRRLDGTRTLGEAIQQAQREAARVRPTALDAVLGTNLLGDPATPIFH